MRLIRHNFAPFLIAAAATLILTGCGSTPASRKPASGTSASSGLPPAGSGRGGYYKDDGPGENPPENLAAIPDAEPKVEPYSKATNRPYVIFGKTYTPITDNRPLKQRGVGSWYGKKFHGQKTASGELYDMYKMTAAHTTLPIPSYARVTNLSNGRQVIVRINDRGPFHAGRIIDLSYTAASKLGYLGAGSAQLEVERLLPDDIAQLQKERNTQPTTPTRQESVTVTAVAATPTLAALPGPSAPVPAASQSSVESMLRNDASPAADAAAPTAQTGSAGNFYIQLGAYSHADSAEAVRAQFQPQCANAQPSVESAQNGTLYRVFCGPFGSREAATAAAQRIQDNSAIKPLVVQR